MILFCKQNFSGTEFAFLFVLMLGKVLTAALFGSDGLLIAVEAHVGLGIPAFLTVGMPDTAVRESKVRVEAALKNSGFLLPSRRVLINMAPADVRKEGAGFDLAIALAVLAGMDCFPVEALDNRLFVGELALDGSLRAVPGVIIYAKLCRELGLDGLVIPEANLKEAQRVPGIKVDCVQSLPQLVRILKKEESFPVYEPMACNSENEAFSSLCFSEVRGMIQAKRAMQIAAVGGHHVLLNGPPGTGKTMLSERFVSILPPLEEQAQLEVLSLYSLVGQTQENAWISPFRAPHHSLSTAALIGGGSHPRPGEISLAHQGVLFLDEFSEFKAEAINALRQPMESGKIVIARAQRRVTYDAKFQLIAATNPCPCGYLGHPVRTCQCTPMAIERYRVRLNGPVADRFDLSVKITPEINLLEKNAQKSVTLREQVLQARHFRETRQQKIPNRDLSGESMKRYIRLFPRAEDLLLQAAEKFSLSSRAIDRVLRVARSIADLAQSDNVTEVHLSEAMQFRHDLVQENSWKPRAGKKTQKDIQAHAHVL